MIIYRDTYVERQKGESANDRNDRAIREATLWYKNHLADHASEDNVIL
jgi:exosome complex exonuclease DIS3/RRP44